MTTTPHVRQRAFDLTNRLAHTNDGVALVEFAFVLPILFLIYIGSSQLCDAIGAQRKVTLTTRTIGDLVSRKLDANPTVVPNIAPSELQADFQASSNTMTPYSATGLSGTVSDIKITSVTTTGGVTTSTGSVQWSNGYNTTKLVANSVYTLSGSYPINSYVIVVSTNYTYTPTMGATYIGNIPMSDNIVFFPRNSATSANITCSAC